MKILVDDMPKDENDVLYEMYCYITSQNGIEVKTKMQKL